MSWSDTCIVNVSSRGLMIHSGRNIALGMQVELRRGDHAIVARVMWRDGARIGLQAEGRVPVDEIMALDRSPALQLPKGAVERRKQPRLEERNRRRGRAVEFAGVAVIASVLTGAVLMMVETALAAPLAAVSAAFGP